MEPTGKLYDLSVIESISGGDQAFITHMIQLFIDTMSQDIIQLQQAKQNENWVAVRTYAHKMKPTIDSMGIGLLHDDIRTLEAAGKSTTGTEQLPALIENVSTIITACIAQLKKEQGM